MEECTNSYGRKIKVPKKLSGFLLTSLTGPTTRKRTQLVQTLAGIRSQTEVSTTDPIEVQQSFKLAIDAHADLIATQDEETALLSEEDKKSYDEFYEEEISAIAHESETIKTFIVSSTDKLAPKEPEKNPDTQSNTTKKTTQSRASKERQRLAAEVAKRIAVEEELKALKEQTEIEEQRRTLKRAQDELEAKEKLLKVETNLRIANARIKLYEQLEEQNNNSLNDSQRLSDDDTSSHTSLSPITRTSHKRKEPPKHESTRNKKLTETPKIESLEQTLHQAFTKMATALEKTTRNTALVEPQVFKGDPLEYLRWKRMFEELVEKDVTPERRLVYLMKYTAGPALDCIENVPFVETEEAYLEAMKALDERFGDQEEVHEAYRSKIREWPFIKEGDGPAIRKYADFLGSCLLAIGQVPSLKILDEPSENRFMLRKLPRRIVDKWSYKVETWIERQGKSEVTRKFPPFAEFVRFVKLEARVENGFVKRQCRPKPDLKGAHAARVLMTDIGEEEWYGEELKSPTKYCVETVNFTQATQPCSLCDAKHTLDQCNKFREMRLDARSQVLRREGRCRRCLQRGHMARGCISTTMCQTCQRGHHTLVHDDDYKPRPRRDFRSEANTNSGYRPTERAQVNFTKGEGEDSAHIVPLYLSSATNPEIETLCYAVLDNQSSSTFITSEMLRNLHLRGTEVTLKLETIAGTEMIETEKLTGLMVRGAGKEERIPVPRAYARETISAVHDQIPNPETIKAFPHLQDIADTLKPVSTDIPIGMLIGRNCMKAIKPKEIRPGQEDDPYGVRTWLGWGVVGNLKPSRKTTAINAAEVFTTNCGEIAPDQILKILDQDFIENQTGKGLSLEDRKFLKKMEEGARVGEDGRITLPLPLKDDRPFPDNSREVLGHMRGLKKRLIKDPDYHRKYCNFMNKMLKEGHAEKAPKTSTPGRTFRLQHRGIHSEKKPDEVRVCMNASAIHQGTSLNARLLRGPDLTNSLQGVMLRFRKEDIALTCDVQAMFYQVLVAEEDRDLLRFYWYPEGDLSKEPEEYRMRVHTFGATSSPGCCNYALKKLATDNAPNYDPEVVSFIRDEFYVDDGLVAKDEEDVVLKIAEQSQDLCKRGGFVLHKFACSSPEVLRKIAVDKLAKGLQKIDWQKEAMHIELTLGMRWQMLRDCFVFSSETTPKPVTRRGILATTSSIFDPLGLIAPLVLRGKRILQDVCQQKKMWDEKLDQNTTDRWREWIRELKALEKLEIPRCYKPKTFGKAVKAELHFFSDASITGYGQCTYLRLTNAEGVITTALVYAKARVTPLKPVTVPRLELTAAVTSAKIAAFLRNQLTYPDISEIFWTDSKVVLGYLTNTSKRYHTFVANRVQRIRELTNVESWRHIETEINPADYASRGLTAADLVTNQLWFQGPPFLRLPDQVREKINFPLLEADPEVRVETCLRTEAKESWSHAMERKCQRFSTWKSLVRAITTIHRLQTAVKRKQSIVTAATNDLKKAESEIIKWTQETYFPEITKFCANPDQRHFRGSPNKELMKLNPFLDAEGIMRVGGRISRAPISFQQRHPILLHKRSHIALLLVRKLHRETGHGGRESTLAAVRRAGFWINAPRALISGVTWNCIWCTRYQGKPQQQVMGQLPTDRLTPSLPFQFSAVDVFGPFFIKIGRSQVKRFVAMYVCLVSGAVHLESLASLSTDSFINSLRRMIARQGQIQELRCDQGTNFMGSHDVTLNERTEFDHDKIKNALRNWQCEYVLLKPHPPHASNMNGACERQIRTARRVWCGLLEQNPGVLTDESFPTLLCEVEAVMNWRPLTTVDQSDSESPLPLAPASILTQRPIAPGPPPGQFAKPDLYLKASWKRIQHLTDEFWRRWRTELLPTKIARQKWHEKFPNLEVGDLIIIMDENAPRNSWQLARVKTAQMSKDGVVRSIVATNSRGSYERPVNKVLRLNLSSTPVREPIDENR